MRGFALLSPSLCLAIFRNGALWSRRARKEVVWEDTVVRRAALVGAKSMAKGRHTMVTGGWGRDF
jgi:hypothetical protein